MLAQHVLSAQVLKPRWKQSWIWTTLIMMTLRTSPSMRLDHSRLVHRNIQVLHHHRPMFCLGHILGLLLGRSPPNRSHWLHCWLLPEVCMLLCAGLDAVWRLFIDFLTSFPRLLPAQPSPARCHHRSRPRASLSVVLTAAALQMKATLHRKLMQVAVYLILITSASCHHWSHCLSPQLYSQ